MKNWLIGGGIVGALVAALLVGGFVVGVLAKGPTPPEAATAPQATITPEEARTAALEAYPGTTVIEVEPERELGVLVYEVELDNGLEVLVDPGDATILGLDQETPDGPGDVDGIGDTEDAGDSTGG
jgi:hypothetical protein